MKKSLIFWLAAITCAAWILVGCESPTDGTAGAAGKNVGFVNQTNVAAADLAALFKAADIVTLGPSVGTVEGVVPAGKKLAVSGETTVGDSSIDGTETLEIKSGGSVEVYEGAALNAGYVSGTAGYLKGAGAISGVVTLPYFGAGVTGAPEGIVTYNSPNAPAGKSVGGYVAASGDASSAATALDVAGIKAIFGLGVNTLSVGNLSTAIDAATVPADKTLTVNGEASIEDSLDLSSAGTLIVGPEGTLTANGNYTITGKATDPANIEIKGTLSVGGGVTIAGKVDLSAANVTNSAAKTLTLPAGAAVIGKITPIASDALTIAGTGAVAVTVTEVVGVASSAAVTIGANATLTIPSGGSLTIGTASSIAAGSTTLAAGTYTATGGAVSLPATGVLAVTGALTGTPAIAGAAAAFGSSFAELYKVKGGSVEVSGDVTAAADIAALAAYEDTDVTASGSATDLSTVAGGIVVAEGNEITLSGAVTTIGTNTLTVNGVLNLTGAATLAAAGDITVNGTLDVGSNATALAPEGNVIVNGTVNLDGSAVLTIKTTKVLTIGEDAAGTGAGLIKAKGSGSGGTITIADVEGYTTTGTGVAANAIEGALEAFAVDAQVLDGSLNLSSTFGVAGSRSIGSLTVSATTATAVHNTADGTEGTAVVITNGTTFEGTLDSPTQSGTNNGIDGTITLSVAAGELKIADAGYQASAAKLVVLTFSGLKLKNSELIAPTAVPDFSIGLKTGRSA
ncbi:MAG: hypothetical protein LBF83_06415 [Spirochaetaceae bacterium]|jgi:filamentous hemagglutinin|nr:hypothetical protein [Spirochaetaceae bacterium]